MSTSEELQFVADGINASTGAPIAGPASLDEMVALAEGAAKARDAGEQELLDIKKGEGAHFGTARGIDPSNLAEAGWCVVFPAVKPGTDDDRRQAAILAALKPLLDHRKAQATKDKDSYYRELRHDTGYRPGETGREYLGRLSVDPSQPADPESLPYYILLVGSPAEIPFSVQYQLDVIYAVGRLHFDTLDDYARYAQSVVESETRPLRLSREIAFFGVRNPDDKATQLSRETLVAPLADVLQNTKRRAKDRDLETWKVSRYFDEAASKSTLGALLGGDKTPALIFTASHGVNFNLGDNRQERHQGALLCSDWENPHPFTPLSEDVYFSGDDLASTAALHGLIAFNFACYGAGTPDLNEYAHREAPGKDRRIAARPFLANLPRRLLAHPRGGALAAIGHIERAWSDALPSTDGANRLTAFRSVVESLMKGLPVGCATEYLNDRYAYYGTEISAQVQALEYPPDDAAKLRKMKTDLVRTWTTHNDARDYVVTGDPAVRLNILDDAAPSKPREALTLRGAGDATTVAPATSAAPATTATPAAPAAPESASFGIFSKSERPPAEPEVELKSEDLVEVKSDPFRSFAERVVGTLGNLVSDATTLEVRTFVSNTPTVVSPDAPGAAQLRAWTRIKLDGDIDVCVPQVDGQLDTTLWALHVEMVKQAQTHRAEMIRMLLSSIGGFFKP